jgi:predicted nucleotidyltransferase
MFRQANRDAALERALEMLANDERVEAVLLTGSLGRGQGDRWSDIDLDAVVGDGIDVAAVTTEWETRIYREWPVAHHYATEFGSTRVRGFLLLDGLLLDLAFTPIGDLEVWAPVQVLFDRTGRATAVAEDPTRWTPTPDWKGEAGFAAHDVVHAAAAANRGRPWQSLYFLQRIRNRTLALASERRGFDSDDFTHVDDLPADEVRPLEATLVANLEPDALRAAIGRATRAFLDELGRHDTDLARRLSQPLLAITTPSSPAGDEDHSP